MENLCEDYTHRRELRSMSVAGSGASLWNIKSHTSLVICSGLQEDEKQSMQVLSREIHPMQKSSITNEESLILLMMTTCVRVETFMSAVMSFFLVKLIYHHARLLELSN